MTLSRILSFILICLSVSVLRAQSELEMIREKFHVVECESDLQSIIDFESTCNEADKNTIKAYKGISMAMMAEYAFWPNVKLSYFNNGTKLLEYSINTSQNLENTYLRLLLQLNVPKILSYDDYIEADMDYFIKNYSTKDYSDKDKNIFVDALLNSENQSCDMTGIKELKN